MKRFYIRRILRIWPLYYFGICLGVLFGLLFGFRSQDASSLGWYLVFAGAWGTMVHGWVINPAGVLWSISVEEHFYLMVPWVVKYFDRKRMIWFCVALIVLSNACLFGLGAFHARGYMAWTNPFVQFESFSGGFLLCLFLRGGTPKLVTWQRASLLTLSGFGWLASSYWLDIPLGGAATRPGSFQLIVGYALGALGATLIVLAMLGIERKQLADWAIHLGRISYGLYVFHDFARDIVVRSMEALNSAWPGQAPWTTLGIVQIPLSLALTIGMAKISYRYLEKPFLLMKERYSAIESQPIL